MGRGAMSERIIFPSHSAHAVPKWVEIEDAVMIEPAGVASRAARLLDLSAGSALVMGAGTIGCLAIEVLVSWGVDVAVLTRGAASIRRAIEFGARPASPDETFEAVLEAAGTPDAIDAAILRSKAGGQVVLTGRTGHDSISFPSDIVVARDLRIVGSLGSANVWPEVIQLLASGCLHPARLVAATYLLRSTARAFEDFRSCRHGIGKLVIAPNGDEA